MDCKIVKSNPLSNFPLYNHTTIHKVYIVMNVPVDFPGCSHNLCDIHTYVKCYVYL